MVFATLVLGQALPSRAVIWQRAASQTALAMVPGFGQSLVGGRDGPHQGLAMATVGVLAAVLIGSSLVVIGRRRQWLLAAGDPEAEAGLEAFAFKPLVFEPFLGGGLVTAFAPIALQAMGLLLWTALTLGLGPGQDVEATA